MTTPAKQIGAFMLARRKAMNINQTDAAHAAGLTQGQWSYIESGRQEPSLTQLVAIAKTLKTTPLKLIAAVR